MNVQFWSSDNLTYREMESEGPRFRGEVVPSYLPHLELPMAITEHSLQDSYRNGFFDYAPETLINLQC